MNEEVEYDDEPILPRLRESMNSPSVFAESEEDKLIKQVNKFAEDFHKYYVDAEEAHLSEDEIYKKALRLIATGESEDSAKIAAKVLELEGLDFPRWYA